MLGGTDPICLHGVIPQGQCAKCYPTPDPAYYDMERSRMVSAKERRERIATAVLAAMCMNEKGMGTRGVANSLALSSLRFADALIAELDK